MYQLGSQQVVGATLHLGEWGEFIKGWAGFKDTIRERGFDLYKTSGSTVCHYSMFKMRKLSLGVTEQIWFLSQLLIYGSKAPIKIRRGRRTPVPTASVILTSQTREKWNTSCYVNKEGCHSHQWLQFSNVSWWAIRTPRKEKNTCHLVAIRLQPLPAESPKEAQDVKNTGYWPLIAGVPMKGMISVRIDSCIFSYIKRAKFFNLEYLVFFN